VRVQRRFEDRSSSAKRRKRRRTTSSSVSVVVMSWLRAAGLLAARASP